MDTTTFLAQVFGVYLTVVGIAIFIRRKNMQQILADFQKNAYLVFFIGVVLLVVGFIILKYHNIWVGTTETIITLLAWLMLLKGVLYIGLPIKSFKSMLDWYRNKDWYVISGIVTLVIGVYLLRAGF
ncbi:hypothetical protein CL632_02930 [bacterium]|jgi:uncharacterized membrane protein HdeD (DUF308 family)|nr:hypothetical protein [bacterium]MDP6571385.1 DUF308 domain-containing protein [Patescibacteria group bacterium]MDP6756364.1 DUF308 domain-containing protein [Patescibacteria group bacterium]|tara:strand:- start:21553 stop:21933 length:381 start_codon:yes stop_codon:yes gene_type:complete